jgi:hypothetical protein
MRKQQILRCAQDETLREQFFSSLLGHTSPDAYFLPPLKHHATFQHMLSNEQPIVFLSRAKEN